METKEENSAASKHTLSEGRVSEDPNTSSASAQDQTLLKALQDLIIRVVNPKQPNDMNQTHLGPEAGRLITALQEFISSILVRSQSDTRKMIAVRLNEGEEVPQGGDHVEDGKEAPLAKIEIPEFGGDASMNNNLGDLGANFYLRNFGKISLNAVVVLKKLPLMFEEKLLWALREHVFNKMPIRLLSFEKNGSSLQISLLERDAVFARIKSTLQGKMYDEEFLSQIVAPMNRTETDWEVIRRAILKYTKYAILSHTWFHTGSDSEVTYADWNKGSLDANNQGYRKLVNFCKTASNDHHLSFGWMDTVCINKDSSSELDESIRSMYNWYERAAVCIIYLAETVTLSNMPFDRWFTRGWTLQELLAPPIIKFYNDHWQRLITSSDNDKNDAVITEKIWQATWIRMWELVDIRKVPISRRMQLAANRQVTREEDTAYSLMGIFNVSISTAYGEGAERAFFRLLQEILLSSPFALDILNSVGGIPVSRSYSSILLPSSPMSYINRSTSHTLILSRWPIEPLTLTHRGLRISVILMPGISTRDIAFQHDPIGAYYATVHIDRARFASVIPTTYHLLDNKVSGGDGQREDDNWYQLTFAVFNFSSGSDSDIILLPKTCIAIALECKEPPGKVSSTSPITYRRTHKPIVFELKNKKAIDKSPRSIDGWYWHVKKDELANHGMQLITMYL